jgi:hypothetical protein
MLGMRDRLECGAVTGRINGAVAEVKTWKGSKFHKWDDGAITKCVALLDLI